VIVQSFVEEHLTETARLEFRRHYQGCIRRVSRHWPTNEEVLLFRPSPYTDFKTCDTDGAQPSRINETPIEPGRPVGTAPAEFPDNSLVWISEQAHERFAALG